jgi:cytochrome c556
MNRFPGNASRTPLFHILLTLSLAASLSLLCLGPVNAGQKTLAELPDSLANWYKPSNKRQVWLHTMFAMRRELQAVQEYGEQADAAHLAKWAERLAKHYRRIPEMVPEWADEVSLEHADALLKAAESGDFAAAQAAAMRLGRTCRSCHREYRALAAARLRTADFKPIRVSVDDEELAYGDFMERLSRSVNRIKIAAEDQRWQTAATAQSQLREQLGQLGETCVECHRDPQARERILGQAMLAGLDKLSQGIKAQDPKALGHQLGTSAVEVCARCHGVHRTLADLRDYLFND